MRALIALVVVMGLAILIGSTTLVVLLVQRAHAPTVASLSGATVPAPTTPAPATLTLSEPEGTRIAATAVAGDRLVVQLSGGGPDRLVVLDLRANTLLARVALGH